MGVHLIPFLGFYYAMYNHYDLLGFFKQMLIYITLVTNIIFHYPGEE